MTSDSVNGKLILGRVLSAPDVEHVGLESDHQGCELLLLELGEYAGFLSLQHLVSAPRSCLIALRLIEFLFNNNGDATGKNLFLAQDAAIINMPV